MRIGRAPARVISEITIDADMDFLDTYQVGSLHSPAADEALRKGNKDIADAEISDTAAIAKTKLNLALALGDAEIAADAAIALTKLAWGRIGISELQWTLNKLLLGGGVGNNPTAVAIGTGAGEVAAGDHTHTLVEDTTGYEESAIVSDTILSMFREDVVMGAETEVDLVAKTLTFAANSRAVAVGFCYAWPEVAYTLKYRLYMGGELVYETGTYGADAVQVILVGTKALSGSQECKLAVYNTDVAEHNLRIPSLEDGGAVAAGIGVGSIKI